MARLSALVIALGVFLIAGLGPAHAEKRVALVIGNSDYSAVPALANPSRDAAAVADALGRIGFDVTLKRDLDFTGLRRTLREFSRAADGAEVAMIYYAGHGIEVDGTNFLIPVDAELRAAGDVDFEAIPLNAMINTLEGAQHFKLVVLDACRDNPFATQMVRAGATRSIGRGLARVSPRGNNTLVAYAAREGTTAADGDGRHSPYTRALLNHIERPDLEVRLLFGHVRDDVLRLTGNRQEPFTYGSLGGTPVYLAAQPDGSAGGVQETVEQLQARLQRLERQLEQSLAASGADASAPDAADRRLPGFDTMLEKGHSGALNDVIVLEGGDVVVAGSYRPDRGAKDQAVLARLDARGTVLWDRTFTGQDGAAGLSGYAVTALADGGFALLGPLDPPKADVQSIWIASTDENGQVRWQQTLGKAVKYAWMSMAANARNEIVVASNVEGSADKDEDLQVWKLNGSGEVLWHRTFPNPANDTLQAVKLDGDRILVLVIRDVNNTQNSVSALLELDGSGRKIGERVFSGETGIGLVAFARLPGGDWAFAGYDHQGGTETYDLMVMRTDAAGTVRWRKRFDFSTTEDLWDLLVTPEGQIIAVGTIARKVGEKSRQAGLTLWLDGEGNLLGRTEHGESTATEFIAVAPLQGGRAVIAGHRVGRNDEAHAWVLAIPDRLSDQSVARQGRGARPAHLTAANTRFPL